MSPLARVGQSSLRAATRSSPAQVRTIYTTKGHVAHNVRPLIILNYFLPSRSLTIGPIGPIATELPLQLRQQAHLRREDGRLARRGVPPALRCGRLPAVSASVRSGVEATPQNLN